MIILGLYLPFFTFCNIKTLCNNKYSSSKLDLAAVIVDLSFAFVYNFHLRIANIPSSCKFKGKTLIMFALIQRNQMTRYLTVR